MTMITNQLFRLAIVFFLLLGITISASCETKKDSNKLSSFKNDPDGFRDIKWGTDISLLDGMQIQKPLFKLEPKDYATYKMAGDHMYIGDVPLESIRYIFFNNQFMSVDIDINAYEPDNYVLIRNILFEKYGEVIENTSTVLKRSAFGTTKRPYDITKCSWGFDSNENFNANSHITLKRTIDPNYKNYKQLSLSISSTALTSQWTTFYYAKLNELKRKQLENEKESAKKGAKDL